MFSSLDRKKSAPIPIPQQTSTDQPERSRNLQLLLQKLQVQNDQQQSIFKKLTDYFKLNDISQPELVGSWEVVGRYLGTELHKEAIFWVISCLNNHYNDCDLLRLDFFKICLKVDERDVGSCVKLLCALTRNGRDLKNFEHDIGRLLAVFVKVVVKEQEIIQEEVMDLICNVVRYSSIYIKESEMDAIFMELYNVFGASKLLKCSIIFIDTVSRYSLIPEKSLLRCIIQLCAGYPQKECQGFALQVFQNLLKTLVSNIVCQHIVDILYQTSEQPWEILLGATAFAEEILKQNELSDSHHFVLSVLILN